jgi:hypothetical protein
MRRYYLGWTQQRQYAALKFFEKHKNPERERETKRERERD